MPPNPIDDNDLIIWTTTPGQEPSNAQMNKSGRIGLNEADGRMFTRRLDGSVRETILDAENMPISNVQQGALDGKVGKVGDELVDGVKTFAKLANLSKGYHVDNGTTYSVYYDNRNLGPDAFGLPNVHVTRVFAGATGHRVGLFSEISSTDHADNKFIVGGQFNGYVETGGGLAFGSNPVARALTGAGPGVQVLGEEVNFANERAGGADIAVKGGLQVVELNTSIGAGSVLDFSISIGKQAENGGASGTKVGILFGNLARSLAESEETFPVKVGGTLIKVQRTARTLNALIDFSEYTGTATAGTVHLRQGQEIAWANAGVGKGLGGLIRSDATTNGDKIIFTDAGLVVQNAAADDNFFRLNSSTKEIESRLPGSPGVLKVGRAVAEAGGVPYHVLNGLVGNGIADDTAVIQAGLNGPCVDYKVPLLLKPGVSYRIATCLTVPDDAGIIGIAGAGFVTSHLDFSSTTKQVSGQGTIVALGNRARFEASIAHTSKQDGYVYGVIARGKSDIRSRGMKITGLNRGSAVKLDSVTGAILDGIKVYDAYLNLTGSSGQSTAIEIDGDKTSVDSSCLILRGFDLKRGLCLPAWAQAYGYQTDGLNPQNTVRDSYFQGNIEEFGELLDAWSQNCIYDLTGKNAYDWGFKFIHGAQDNLLRGVIDGSGLSLVTISDGNIGHTARNTVHVRGRNAGTRRFYDPPTNSVAHSVGVQAAINIEDHSGTNKCISNVVYADLADVSAGASFAASIQGNGTGNIIHLTGDASIVGKEAPASGNANGVINQLLPAGTRITYPGSNRLRNPDSGTFTATLSAVTTAPTGVVHTSNTFQWTRSNGEMHINGRLIISSAGSGGVGQVRLNGLPQTVRSGATDYMQIVRFSNISGLPAGAIIYAYISGSSLVFEYQSGGSGYNDLLWSQIGNATDFILKGSYPI